MLTGFFYCCKLSTINKLLIIIIIRTHLNMTRVGDVNEDVDVTYRTLNVMDDEERYIYFIPDPPHLIRTAGNCLANSLAGGCTTSMWNDGKFLTWNHISKLFIDDLDCGLNLVPKITNDHIRLTPFSVINVRAATQVLSVITSCHTFWQAGIFFVS